MFLKSYSSREIIEELNNLGYKTKTGNPFGHNSLISIFRNEKHIGNFIFNKLASKDARGKRNGSAYKDPEEIIKVTGIVPKIIEPEDFFRVRKRIHSRKKFRGANNAKEAYLLSGKLLCGECEGAFVGSRKYAGRNKTLQVTYRCNMRKSKHICTNKEIRREYIEAFVLESLSEHVYDYRLMYRLVKKYKSYQEKRYSELISRRNEMKRRRTEPRFASTKK